MDIVLSDVGGRLRLRRWSAAACRGSAGHGLAVSGPGDLRPAAATPEPRTRSLHLHSLTLFRFGRAASAFVVLLKIDILWILYIVIYIVLLVCRAATLFYIIVPPTLTVYEVSNISVLEELH